MLASASVGVSKRTTVLFFICQSERAKEGLPMFVYKSRFGVRRGSFFALPMQRELT